MVGILGPNGSGKTTLLRILSGTRRPQRGTVTLDGAPLASRSRGDLARLMAVVPQETHLAFDYTVAEVTMMGRYPHLGVFEIEGPADVGVVEETLASTGTLHLKDRLFATLSGGERMRAGLACLLGAGQAPDILILDEPTNNLDLSSVGQMVAALKEYRGVLIVVSHDRSFVDDIGIEREIELSG